MAHHPSSTGNASAASGSSFGSGSPAAIGPAGRRSPYNTMSRAGAEVAGTQPLTTSLASSCPPRGGEVRESHGSEMSREPQAQTGRFGALRTMLKRFGRRDRQSQNQSDVADAGSSPQPQQRSSGFPWGGARPACRNPAEGLFAQPQYAREGRDAEFNLHRSLEGNGERGAGRSLPLRMGSPAVAAATASLANATSREAAEARPLRGPSSGPPRSGWIRDPSQSPAPWESAADASLDDEEDILMARIFAQGLRDDRRHDSSSSSSAAAASPPRRPSYGLPASAAAGMAVSLSSGEMMPPRATPHGALAAYSGSFGRRGFQYSLPVHGLDGNDMIVDTSLQEAIEQSKKAHLLAELPREKYQKERHKSLVECELCLMEYEVGDELLRLPCMHLFHCACVTPWLRKAYTCPVCQTDICQAAGL